MASQITQKLFWLRSKLLLRQGINKGEIKPFSDEIYNKMKDTYLEEFPYPYY